MFSTRMQSRLSLQSLKLRPFFFQTHLLRLGSLTLHGAFPSRSRCTTSNSSKDGSNIFAPVTQAQARESFSEASQNQLNALKQSPEEDPVCLSTIDRRELLLSLLSRQRPLTDWEEATKITLHGLDTLDEPWGFVIYRAVYGEESDEPWKRMMSLLRDTITRPDTFEMSSTPFHPNTRTDPRYELTIMEDEERFAGADSHTIREAFREWVAYDLPPRVPNPEALGGIGNIKAMIGSKTIRETYEHGPTEPLHPYWSAPPRWGFCLLVDDFCLRSLNRADGYGPVVKIVNLHFPGNRCERIAEGWEDGETDDDYEDVGWMYAYASSYQDWYRILSDPTNWNDEVWYTRPAEEEYPITLSDL